MRLVWGAVQEVLLDVEQTQHLSVALDDGTVGRATAFPSLTGRCLVGDRVLLNTTAVDLELGTGGTHFVVARAGSGTGVALDARSGGHIMKLRYTPLQIDVLAVEEQHSPHHSVMQDATDLGGMPVACCGLHSQVPLVAAAIKSARPGLRVAYVMTDEAALAIGLSGILRQAVDAGLLDATVTCGQAFGGLYEAVNLYSGLLAARHVARADVAIVAIGPGVVGTATPFGHGGIAQGAAINAAASLGGRPVAVLRLSFVDERPRHHGVSHHTTAALTRVALAPATVAVPALPSGEAETIDRVLAQTGVWALHSRFDAVGPTPDMRGLQVTTMGRSLEDDPSFFAAAWAAGEACCALSFPADR